MHIEHEALTELVAREGFAQLLCPSYIRSECTLKHLYLHSVKSNFVLEFNLMKYEMTVKKLQMLTSRLFGIVWG